MPHRGTGEFVEEHPVNITITGRHLEITPAIRQHAEDKANKLTKYYDLIQEIEITVEQADNAATIAGVGLAMGMPDHAVTVALATALQESGLRNLPGLKRPRELGEGLTVPGEIELHERRPSAKITRKASLDYS